MDNLTASGWMAFQIGIDPEFVGEHTHIFMSIIALLTITVASILTWRRIKGRKHDLLPEDKTTLVNVFEIIISAILALMEDVMGSRARKHFPIVGAVFIYILVCNLMAIVPGLSPPTENINTNLACATAVFVYYNYIGIREHGVKGYFKNMSGNVIWIAPLILAIEIISHVVRPLSLSVRLLGNMMGDHMVLGIFSDLLPFVVPTLFMMLAIFVALIQAFVFTLLSVIYISLATERECE